MEFIVRNVNEALPVAWHAIRQRGLLRPSRNGPMVEMPCPVTTTYKQPRERVLFSPMRDANPFLHLFEAMWHLAGRNDVGFLARFSKQMLEYSDDGQTLVSAYGMRWNRSIDRIVSMLMHDPDTRRAYMPIYDYSDVGRTGKDTPCNLGVDFKIRPHDSEPKTPHVLDMTVWNRSNDMLWGAYGANVVTFSYLQEYVACLLGVPVGHYSQISASFHYYPEFEVAKKLDKLDPAPNDPYERGEVAPYDTPMLTPDTRKIWSRELDMWMDDPGRHDAYVCPWFNEVLIPMFRAWNAYKQGASGDTITAECENIVADDWGRAAFEWIDRRLIARQAKTKEAKHAKR